nr:hypothetical protein [Tanacetum cinerariifolium]
MHSEGDDLPINKLSNTVEGKFKFGIEISDAMIDDVLKKTAGYKYYKAKKVEKTSKEIANETNVADESDIDLIDDNPVRDDDAAGYGVFMFNKTTQTPNSTHLNLTITIAVFEAQCNINEGDVSKPRSFKHHMSKSSKPHPSFYNNDFYYLVDLNTKEKYTSSLTKHYPARYHIQGERMVYLDNPLRSSDNVLNNQIFDTTSDDSYQSNVEMYLNDEEDDGDNLIIPQTLSKEIMTRIDNTKCPPSFIKEIGEDEI